MKKIVYITRMFQTEQTLMVYEDGNKIDMIQTTLENMYLDMFALMKKHNVWHLDLIGPKAFSTGLSKEIEVRFFNHFSKEESVPELEINII